MLAGIQLCAHGLQEAGEQDEPVPALMQQTIQLFKATNWSFRESSSEKPRVTTLQGQESHFKGLPSHS